jgi:hypothetical protein
MADLATSTALSPRDAVFGIDSNNQDLFESACLKSASMSVVAGPITIEGWTAVSEFFRRLFALVTTHAISNVRVELEDGADTASVTANAISYHVRPGEALQPEDTSYTASCLYFIDLVKDSNDGLWKIKTWEIKMLWTTGDRAVLHG